jgi:hypothetical protein
MKCLTTITMLFAIVPLARAQDAPPVEEFDLVKAIKQIEKLMVKAETSLLKSVAREKAAQESREAVEEIEKLLRGHEKQGKEIVDKINELLVNLPQQSGGGGGQSQPMPKSDDKKDGQKKKEKQLGDRDPQNSREGEKETKGDPDPKDDQSNAKPPPEELKEKAEVKPDPDWLPRLPPQVREDIQNGNFESVPEKYRALVEAWMKKMAEMDK